MPLIIVIVAVVIFLSVLQSSPALQAVLSLIVIAIVGGIVWWVCIEWKKGHRERQWQARYKEGYDAEYEKPNKTSSSLQRSSTHMRLMLL